MARLLAALLTTAVTAAPALAQQDTRPAFAVATIKKNGASHQTGGPGLPGADEVDRLVVDRTGLTGAYNFDLEYALDTAGRGGAPPADSATAVTDRPSLFTALEEQLGLKLQPQRAPIELLVIDRVTPPTEN